MNKELIKKYKAEFDHWLNGGELLYAYIDGTFSWKNMNAIDKNIYPVYARNPFQISEYHIIIINDEYVEFRKALAEGKIVQEQDYHSKQWFDMKTPDFHGASDTQYEGVYRIKPEELKFKVGDWVRDLRDNRIFQINSENFNLNLSITNGVYVHWQPKPGEWCWYSKWDKIVCVEFYLCKFVLDMNEVEPEFKHKYEPFIGELPTFLKENT